MRRFAFALALIALPLSTGMGQQPAELKHLTISVYRGVSARISAENMVRDVSVLHLKGSVEIHLPRGDKQDWILRADEADFNIDTCAVEPRGNVSVTPEIK